MTKRVPNMRKGRNITWMFSHKNEQSVFIDSFLEQTYANKLELSPEVKAYATQPESMHVNVDGKKCRYTPGFLVVNHDGTSIYVEVHHNAFINDEYLKKLDAAEQYINETTSSSFLLVDEAELPMVVGKNIQMIVMNRNATELEHVDVSQLPDVTTYAELYRLLSDDLEDPAAAIYELIAIKVFKYDECVIFGPSTQLVRAQ
ncbi:TnsA endonuclease N-terminal domain-containing protein [Shewanella colwelliana]|uniref:TnsA endonuclease N-terminal domain-containing protein n=1 Tax=Shewanella colwelliana TaxID=23 RepID=UPI00049073F7|nr:TnsA endonuclease N-terminal domain-containing protein [Shewanella colwelliana]